MTTTIVLIPLSVFIMALLLNKVAKRNKVVYGDKNYNSPIPTNEEIESLLDK